MKKKTEIIEEMKNSQQFLSKLNGFKKASKQMKDKNKLVSHRNIWVKEYKYLSRLQRDCDLDIKNYLSDFDRYFDHEIEDRQIFGRESYKNYSEFLQNSNEELDMYEHQIWEQLRSLPLLLTKTKQMKTNPKAKQNINLSDVKNIVRDIGGFLSEMEETNMKLTSDLNQSQLNLQKIIGEEQDNEDGENQFTMLQNLIGKKNFDDVKGFDFEKEQIKRIQIGEMHLREYLEELSDRLSEDEILGVISQYQHASNLLYQTLELELQKINLDYEEVLNLDEEMLSMSDNYHRMQHIYNTYLGRGKSITLYHERLGIQFPKINRKVLQRVTEFIEAKIYKQRKINAVRRNYLRQKQQLLQKVQKEVNERIENKIKKAQREAEQLQRRQEKLKLEQELEKLRKQYNDRQSEKQKIEKQEEEKKKNEERKKQAIRRLYLDELNKKAAEIHQIKEKKQIQEEQKRRREFEIQQIQKKKALSQAKPKVQQRQSVERKKIQKKMEDLKERKEMKVKQEERINKAIEKYSFRPEVAASEERINAPTQAMIKRKQIVYDKADKIELTKMTGYNINQLMGDMRFRLNNALQEAGLANTDYARQVLLGMSKRPEN